MRASDGIGGYGSAAEPDVASAQVADGGIEAFSALHVGHRGPALLLRRAANLWRRTGVWQQGSSLFTK